MSIIYREDFPEPDERDMEDAIHDEMQAGWPDIPEVKPITTRPVKMTAPEFTDGGKS